MTNQQLSTNNNVNTALINIIIIIKNINKKYPQYDKKLIKSLLGLISSNNEGDHIFCNSVNYNLSNYIFEDMTIDNAKLLINKNLLIIFYEIFNIIKYNNDNIYQAELSTELGLNKTYDRKDWITYLFIELMNDLNIIKYYHGVVVRNGKKKTVKILTVSGATNRISYINGNLSINNNNSNPIADNYDDNNVNQITDDNNVNPIADNYDDNNVNPIADNYADNNVNQITDDNNVNPIANNYDDNNVNQITDDNNVNYIIDNNNNNENYIIDNNNNNENYIIDNNENSISDDEYILIDINENILIDNNIILNIHSTYIDKRIEDYKKLNYWNSQIINTTHQDFIKDYSDSVFTNLIKKTFTKSYLKKFKCSDCGDPSTDRCHGIGEERPVLIKRALEKVYPDISKSIKLKIIIIAFLEEHKYTNFTFKCKNCHKKESNTNKIFKQ